uniref:Transmembrane protein n=1 Tax=Steinernema glaseri TaxID=37863 RepID=A0A1I7YJZ9_9BILA
MLRSSFRRTSTVGSSQSLAGRRSSVNQRDIERIQQALLKSKRDPTRWLLVAMLVSPLFIFFYHYAIVSCNGSLFTALVTNQPEDWRAGLPNPLSSVGWISTATIVALQLVFAHALPADEVRVLSADVVLVDPSDSQCQHVILPRIPGIAYYPCLS